ncbi:MAG TPA: diadenylate cyclase CdaA, partial [Gemmatimonadales bacterium]|nr:diadenylate cyclase CdaA [Gemmatimonadales bacterium]
MRFAQFPLPLPTWRDLLEIVLVAFVVYRVLRFLTGTRALQILLGLLLLVLIYVGALFLKLTMITYLLGVVFTYGVFAAIVVFQPELRHALARLGQSPLVRVFNTISASEVAEEVADAVERLSRNGTGAIIAIEREASLADYVESGTPVEATVSADLLATIFSPYAPLHDGAVLIRGDHIIGAGCILPLTQYPVADKSLGTRHRAALGLSEETDALVLVVSEETAVISLAQNGGLTRQLSAEQVRDILSGRTPVALPALAP